MRRTVTSAVPPSMYRHFAIVTVVLTMGLAMFAQGENREAQAAQMVTRPAPKTEKPATFAAPRTTSDESRTPSWFNDGGSEFDSGFGRPMQRLASAGGSILPDIEELGAPGYSPEYLASLSEAERELLLKGLQENGMLDHDIRGDRTAALMEQSRRRSGEASLDE